jgi:trimeric autotransporter adhesin
MKNLVRLSFCALAVSIFGGLAVDAQNITTVAGGGPPAGSTKTAVSVGAPGAVRQDHLGNTYILDNAFSRVYRVDATTGKLSVFAGIGAAGGFSGEGGLATDAAMFEPSGMCIDINNNVYVADSDNAIIREIVVSNPAAGQVVGHIYTVAGTQTSTNPTYGGDTGLATAANLHFPDGCAFDSHGNMYIADRSNNAVRVVIGATNVKPVGLAATTTVAGHIYLYTGSIPAGGNPPATGYAPNGTATVGAGLNAPFDVFVDSHDNLFIADLSEPDAPGNNVIREVPATTAGTMTAGLIYTIVGVPGQSGHDNAKLATLAKINGPEGIFVDGAGNLFFADNGNSVIREVPVATGRGMTAGFIYDIAGNGNGGYGGDGGLALSASLAHPAGTFVDATGTLFIADPGNARIRQVTFDGANYLTQTISTWAGNGVPSYSDGTPPTVAQLDYPAGLALDASGNLAVADLGFKGEQSVIRKITNPVSTGALTTIVGSPGFNGFVNNNTGNYPNYVENDAIGVAFDASGNLYIADTNNCIIRKLSAGVMTTVAGVEPTLDLVNPPNSTPNCGFAAQGGAAVGTKLGAVNSVALDAVGDIFFSDATNNMIWEVPKNTVGTMTGGNAYVIAGVQDTTGSFGGEGGAAVNAHFNKPTGIYVDVYGNLFIADTGNNIVREIPADNTSTMTAGFIYTVAGDKAGQTAGYSGNGGLATSAKLNAPFTIAVDNAENIFIADTNNNVIREVPGVTVGPKIKGDIYTVVGANVSPVAGFAGDGGVATSAQLSAPEGLAIDGAGDLLLGDSHNNRVRSVAGIANLAPVPVAAFDKSSLTFSAQPLNIQSTAQVVTLTNNGGVALTGIAITPTGAGFADTTSCTATLNPGANCTISVTFTPTVVGASSGVITIADNAAVNPQTITLNGSGQNGVPTDALTPNPLAFTPQPMGVPSAALPVTVSNATGTGPLLITGITFGGANGSDFSQTNNCGTLPATVAVGATCTINVVFNPTSGTPAARSATLTLADNATNSSINITGTATLAAISFTPTSLTFASQAVGTTGNPQAITAKNTGTGALTFTSITIAGPNKADFSLAPPATCNTTTPVAPNAQCTISVTYAPAAAGTSTAMVMVADNATGGTQTIALTGTATPAALALNLGAAAGASTSATVTAGQTATYNLQIAANQNASVTFTCTGAPTAATCTVPAAAVAVTAGTPAPVSVTVSTTARGLLVPLSQPTTRMQPPAAIQMLRICVLAMLLLIATLLAMTQSPAGRLRVARAALSACLVLMPLVAATLLVGCGGGGGSSTPPPATGTPAGTYTVVVTATSGSQSAKTNLTLIVQ